MDIFLRFLATHLRSSADKIEMHLLGKHQALDLMPYAGVLA